MISFALEEDQELVRETVKKFARDVLRKDLRSFEAHGVPAEVHQAFAELGLLALELEEGLPHTTSAIIHEELAFGDPGAAVALWSPYLFAPALRLLATPEQRARLLQRAAGQPVLGAVAYAEPGPAPLAGFATTARPAPGGYLLSGEKHFVLFAGQAELTLVFAQVEPEAGWRGFAVFAVAGRPGSEGSYRLGARHELVGLGAVPCAGLVFQDHFVPEADRLAGAGDLCAATRQLLAHGQLAAAAWQVGLARAAYELALQYTQDRRAFGKPVAHFQAIAFTLADMLMDVEAARWLVWRAAAAQGGDRGRLDEGACAQAAAQAAQAAFRVADSCVQLLGGAGFVQDFPAEKWMRDTKVLALLCGSPEILDGITAQQLLGHPLSAEADLPGSALQPILT